MASLRAQIDSADYKNYILSILFLKRLSDRFDEEVEAAVSAGVRRRVALTDPDEHEFFVPEDARWSTVSGAGMNLGGADQCGRVRLGGSQHGKKGGEFYTPCPVVRLIVELPTNGDVGR
ncbi:MAG: type I restriction-modification system subunit M N-terminal domain-containing protein [bacterium]|nr:type I restriction-modification system subunit M N-terminal domain-containing protein [bacterium]MDE0289553.1 type I restriction-modification system subunit M N-terminal domain-containing protein [bacterium]MDE0437709.1 type I restriction-modification system subunit M N-terminal domain-containing protein [bacterium]